MKKNKKLVLLGIIGSLSIISAQAQFAVTNVNDSIYWGPTGIQTRVFANMLSIVDGNMQAQNATQQVQISQQDHNMAVQDSRQRRSAGLAEIAKQDDALRPTIQQCIEITANSYKYGAVDNIFRGTRNRGPDGKFKSIDEAALDIKNAAGAQEAVLTDMVALGTCSAEFGKAAGCNGPGDFARADMNSQSLMVNMQGAAQGRDYANWSLNTKGVEVGLKYIKDVTLGQTARLPSPTQLAKNPAYLAMYKGVMAKLIAAQTTLNGILNFSAGTTLIGTPAAIWGTAKAQYTSIFGSNVQFPTNPSSFEVLNFTVFRDYMIPKPTRDPIEISMDNNRLLAVNNYLLLQQFKAQQNTNVLLSHLLVQAVTPINKDAVDAEYNKTVSLK